MVRVGTCDWMRWNGLSGTAVSRPEAFAMRNARRHATAKIMTS